MEDRSRFDLIYHESTKTGGDDSNVSMAAYRERQRRSGGGEVSSRRPKTSSTLTERQQRLRSRQGLSLGQARCFPAPFA